MNNAARYLLHYALPAVLVACLTMGAAQLRDPTRPPGATDDAGSQPGSQAGDDLLAIIHGKERKIAIIGGQPYELGDKIGEFTITAITPYTVELTDADNGRQVLELVEKIKTDATQQGTGSS